MSQEREITKHEAFGQIQFNRGTCRNTKFYGSELPQDHYISLEISTSELERTITDDRYSPRKELIRVRISSSQFAELITSMNMGTGVPCTIERVEGKKVAELPDVENRKEFVHRKFDDRMAEFAVRLKEKQARARELVKKKTLNKEDIRELDFHLQFLTQEIESNIPFFAKCFQETMDEVVFEAKSEIENAILHKVTSLGLNALHEQNKLLNK